MNHIDLELYTIILCRMLLPSYPVNADNQTSDTHAHTHTQNKSGGRYWSYELIANDSCCTGDATESRPPPGSTPPRRITERVSDGGRSSIGLTNTVALGWPLRGRAALRCQRTQRPSSRGDGHGELCCLLRWGFRCRDGRMQLCIRTSCVKQTHFADEFDWWCVSNVLVNSAEWEESYCVPAVGSINQTVLRHNILEISPLWCHNRRD